MIRHLNTGILVRCQSHISKLKRLASTHFTRKHRNMSSASDLDQIQTNHRDGDSDRRTSTAKTSPKRSTKRLQIPVMSDAEFHSRIDLSRLSQHEVEINACHITAIKAGSDFYTDPVSGLMVTTRLGHITRGKCCGNACRHCPYGQSNVPDRSKKLQYNSAFYS